MLYFPVPKPKTFEQRGGDKQKAVLRSSVPCLSWHVLACTDCIRASARDATLLHSSVSGPPARAVSQAAHMLMPSLSCFCFTTVLQHDEEGSAVGIRFTHLQGESDTAGGTGLDPSGTWTPP